MSDELIDDVAARMTALEGRPDMRTRVAAAIDEAPTRTRPGWMWPVATAGALALMLLAWLVTPSSIRTNETPLVVAESGATEPVTSTPEPAPTPVVRDEPPVSSTAQRQQTVQMPAPPVVAPTAYGETMPVPVDVWTTEVMDDIPTLPLLPGPAPIEIEPIAWNDVTIAPLILEQLHIDTLVIEPLRLVDVGGL